MDAPENDGHWSASPDAASVYDDRMVADTQVAPQRVPFGRYAARAFLGVWDALLFLLLITPVALGWCVGIVTRAAVYAWGAALDGYHKGRGTPWVS